jgi:hypothetical protein
MSFRNEIDQKERAEVLKNDLRNNNASTFLAHTHNDVGGRYAAISSPVVVGSSQIPQYPAAFLQHDPVPDEPALGVDVNAMEPCGQPHELRASIHHRRGNAQASDRVQRTKGPGLGNNNQLLALHTNEA